MSEDCRRWGGCWGAGASASPFSAASKEDCSCSPLPAISAASYWRELGIATCWKTGFLNVRFERVEVAILGAAKKAWHVCGDLQNHSL